MNNCTHLPEKNHWEIEEFRIHCDKAQLLDYLAEHSGDLGRRYCDEVCQYKCIQEVAIKEFKGAPYRLEVALTPEGVDMMREAERR